jgi:hypothetical protein
MSGLILLYMYSMVPVMENKSNNNDTVGMMQGTGTKPYVYRRFVPDTANLVLAHFPLKEALADKLHSIAPLRTYLRWDDRYREYYVVVTALLYFCLFGFMLTLRWIAKQIYHGREVLCDFAPIAAMLLLPPLFVWHKYIYDPATLFLFSLAFGAILAKRDVLYYPVFAAAAFNKETAILLVPLFAVAYWKKRNRVVLSVHVLVQIAIWAAIVLGVHYVYRANIGRSVEFHLLDHNLAFTHLRDKMFSLVFVVLVALVLRFSWRSESYSRQAFLWTFVPLVMLTLFFGWIEETRDYLEAFPPLFALLIPAIRNLYCTGQPESGLSCQ